MWSSSSAEEQQNSSSRALKRVSSSSSTTASSSAHSPSPFSYQNPRAPKTMEEVWKEISISSPALDDRTSTSLRGLLFQDFLSRPFDKDMNSHQNNNIPRSSTFLGGDGLLTPQRIVSPVSAPPPPPPYAASLQHHLPATRLTLNSSGPEFSLFGNLSPCPSSRQSTPIFQPRNISNPCALNAQYDEIGSCYGGMITAHGKDNKRCAIDDEINNNIGDRRHKRMIKNRESAARSRARKQAYTTELELAVELLTEENARLKEQQRQLCEAVEANPPARRKQTLHRTSTF